MLKPTGPGTWLVLSALGVLLSIGCDDAPPAEPGGPDAGPAEAPPTAPAGADAGGAGDLRPRDAFIPPTPPAPNGPWPTWASKDIGAVASPGKVWSSMSGLRVESGGAAIGGVADSFHFVSRKVGGDFEIVSRVQSLQMASPESTAGLMVRANDTEPGAAAVYLGILADRTKGGVLLQRSAGGAAAVTAVSDVGLRDGQWLRITRRGRTFSAYRSAGLRVNWTRVGSVDLDLPAEVSVGLAVASKNPARSTVSEVGALRLHNLDSQPATRDWTLDELGAAAGGTATHEADGLKLAGIGEPLSLLQDSGLYAYQTAQGDQMLTVKVGAFTHRNAPARVGLMLREGPAIQLLISRATPAVVLTVTADMGVQFMSRILPNMMGTVAMPVTEVKAPVWLRLTRTEVPGQPALSRVTGSYSIDGIQWTQVGAITFSLPEPFLIGAYASSNGGSVPVSAGLTEVSLTRPPPDLAPDAGAPPADASASEGGL
jgi:regulation of enolase protein 1 (concanavalin A-like superfamily)